MFPNYSISTSRTSSPKMTMSIAKDRTCKSKWLRDTGRPSALPESSAQVRQPQTLIALHCSKSLGSQETPKRLPACPHTVCSSFPGFPVARGAMRGLGLGGGTSWLGRLTSILFPAAGWEGNSYAFCSLFLQRPCPLPYKNIKSA